jgi:D-alanyl-D-alanine carboxypeptidase/D-alanyl-D-alanine-endopeptidase (penicillin-binding protein 4)
VFKTALLTVVALCAVCVNTPTRAQVPPSVQKVINAYKIPDSSISLLVQDVGSVSPLVSLNTDVPRNPASSIKLLTTFVALDVLGPTYSWPTKLYALGPIKDGVLDGDLVLKGYGDPYLIVEEFWKLLGELRARGVQTINGDLVIDDSHFAIPDLDPGAFDQQPDRLYNVVPNAALVNFKAVEFQFFPVRDGSNVLIKTRPKLPNLKITNQLKIKNSKCQGYNVGIKMDIPDRVNADHVVFSGSFPSGCRSYSLNRSVLQPASYAFGTFQHLWGHWGGTISGSFREGLVPSKKRPLIVSQSRPLAEIIRAVNKWSNNVMTRLLLYSLGTSKYGPPVTKEQGIEVLREYLQKNDLDDSELILDNGSGLSRTTRITATLMNGLLRHAYRDPYMPEFIASMSINGIDGTTRRRFRGRPERGRMHLKTGSLNNVSAIAGYVLAASGTTYSVVLMLNHNNVHQGSGKEIQNALLKWVYRQ